MAASGLARTMHRVHRAVGSVLALLIAVWFASGAVMTFSGFPRFTERERLESAPPLPTEADVALPPLLARDLTRLLADGSRVRLAMLEGEPTWVASTPEGERVAYRAAPPWTVERLSEARARAEAERRFGLAAVASELLTESDQWTVALATSRTLPYYRVRFGDGAASEAYVSARTGELVQVSTRKERILAWLGAIPHWIYPTVLRRERELWRDTVLVLSAVGLAVTLSGMIAGIHVYRATRKRKAPRDPYLRWHQALGLWFGVLACTWLLSGALSLTPMQWSGPRGLSEREQTALYGAPVSPMRATVAEALARCQAQGPVRELELGLLGGHVLAVCASDVAAARVVDLMQPAAEAQDAVAPALVASVATRLGAGAPLETSTATDYDAYYYPTHSAPDAVLPFVRMAAEDDLQTVYYLDPVRGRLLRKHTRLTRLERWLYHGLHSLDIPGLYEHRALWRTLVVAAMAAGCALSTLGGLMWLRRLGRKRARRRREAQRASPSVQTDPA